MIRAGRFGLLALLAGLITACGPPPTVTGGASPSSVATPSAAGASPSPNPSPQLACSATNRCLVLVTLRGSTQVVVRDLTDIAHPKTVSSLGAIPGPVFVSATEISYDLDGPLYRAPLSGLPKTLVTRDGGAGAWSPDGSSVVFTTAVSPETTTVHQWQAGRDQVLGSVPGGGGGGCETIQSCQIPNFLDFRLLYSPDGTMVSLVTTGFSGSSFRVWSADGSVMQSSDAQGPTFSAWSGAGLYYRDSKGVERWQYGTISTFLPGVAWIRPSASPAGGQIVYTVRDSSGWGHIRLVDTNTKRVRELRPNRTDAVFLTPRFVWYRGERACVAADACGANPPFHPESGKTYIYDLQTGTETESIITSVFDAWPHAA